MIEIENIRTEACSSSTDDIIRIYKIVGMTGIPSVTVCQREL